MPYMFIILILIIVVSFLSVKLYLIKKQLRNIAEQMQEQDERAVSLDFVDKDLEAVALNINKKLEQLQMVKIKAVKKEQAMRTSISMISHDMRTPLTSVIGYLQLAEKAVQMKKPCRIFILLWIEQSVLISW